MSPSKLKSLLTGVLVAMFVAWGTSVVAQDGLRLFKPYSPESFGGARRSNDGVYGSVSGIYWSFSTPKGGYIGATTASGEDETRWVWDMGSGGLDELGKVYMRAQTNSIRIDMMSPATTLGTRFEVGNRRGHHGWLVSGYGLPGQSHSMSASEVSMAMRDEATFKYLDSNGVVQNCGYLWRLISPSQDVGMTWKSFVSDGVSRDGWTVDFREEYLTVPNPLPDAPENLKFMEGIPEGQTYFLPELFIGEGNGGFGPAPVLFRELNVNVRSRHYSAELMYTYRAHPFTWGTIELLGGARYWDFEDAFGLTGLNRWDNNPTTGNAGLPWKEGIRAFLSMDIDAKAYNRVFGPQFGMKLSRQNARWTFGAEGRLTAGANVQRVQTSGNIRAFQGVNQSILGLLSSTSTFRHSQTKTYFSPILEGSLSADWQWTSSVSFFGAVNGMVAGNIARGVRVTDYVLRSDGTIFGIRGNDRNTDVFVYGVEAGIKVRR